MQGPEDLESAPIAISDETYRRLAEKHRQCEDRLALLRERLILTGEEKLEEVTLKKQKLLLKDRMEAIVRGVASPIIPR